MQKLLRFVVFVLLMGISPGMLGRSFAQEIFCLDLSEADCDLYTLFSESGAFPSSSEFEANISGTIVGEMPTRIEFEAQITGAYVVSADEIDAALATFGEISVMEANLGNLLDLLRGMLAAVDAEMTIQLTLPPEAGGPAYGPFNLWLVDGVGYLDVTPIGVLTSNPDMAGVMGLDLIDVVEVPLSQVTMGDIGAAFEALGEFGSSDFSTGDGEAMSSPFVENFFAQFANPMTEADIASFATIERLPNETVNGTEVVVFQTTMDFTSMFQVEAIRAQMIANMQMQGLPDDIDAEALADALAESFTGSTMTVVEKFDPQTAYSVATTFLMDMTFDATPMSAVIGEDTGMETLFEFDLTWDSRLTDINNVEAINPPADAQILPVESLFGG